MPDALPGRLQEAADALAFVPDDDRLYVLLDYAAALPALPERYAALREAGMGRVHECQSPVFLFPEVTGDGDGARVRLHADVPEEAPTVRGLVSLLVTSLDGGTVGDVRAVPDDLLARLGLAQRLGMRRQQGFAGVLHRLRHAVDQAEQADAPNGLSDGNAASGGDAPS